MSRQQLDDAITAFGSACYSSGQSSPSGVEARAKVNALVAEMALDCERKVRYMLAGTPHDRVFAEMAGYARRSDLYKLGDTILVWVNEGDIIAKGERLPTPQDTARAAESGEGE